MRISIVVLMIVVISVLVGGVALAVGWLGAEAAGEVVEERLVDQSARNAAALLEEMSLPISDTLMKQLQRILGVEVAAGPVRGGKLTASSLPPELEKELGERLAELEDGDAIVLGGTSYRYSSQQVSRPHPRGTPPLEIRLHLLAPAEQFEAARDRAEARIRAAALPAVAAALALAAAVALTISLPIRKLARKMDRLAAAATQAVAPDAEAAGEPRVGGPSEVVRLDRSFHHLLDNLRAAQAQLARAERLATLGKLAASVAHELRNPLSGIKMNVRLLRDDFADHPGDQRTLAVIDGEIDRMDLYLQELMGMARGGKGDGPNQQNAASEPVDLSEQVEHVLRLLAGRIRHAGVTVQTDFQPAPAARVDPGQVRQVLMNLLINAVEAMPGGGQATVTVRPAAEGRVRVSVTDTGQGVTAPEDADLFDAFTSTKSDGAGLGLYVCRQIVQSHAGRIGYDTAADGATFWFELPVTDGAPKGER